MNTLHHRLLAWAKETPDQIAQRYKLPSGEHKNITAKEYAESVFYMALYLESLDLQSDDVACILSYNLPQWVHMDLAPGLMGSLSAGLYPNASFKDISYILELTQCKVLSVQNKDYFLKATDNGKQPLPDHVQKIIVFQGEADFHPRAISYEQALEMGKQKAQTRSFEDYLKEMDPNKAAYIIFTSGTTGNPKGAMLSHYNMSKSIDMAGPRWNLSIRPDQTVFSFLPLCHIAEKIQNLAAGLTYRFQVEYCSGFDKIADELKDVRPTLLLAVPRLWEKIMEGVCQKIETAPSSKKKMANWAFRVGAQMAEIRLGMRPFSPSISLKYVLAKRLVLKKVAKAIGIDRVKVAASGAASLPAHVAKWFRIFEVDILEVFGQTESTGIICMTNPGKDFSGTVGLPIEGSVFKIADDGEIMVKGPQVFVGYFKNRQATEETVIDGFLHTGDLGAFDKNGHVKIIGRKKEILKTSGGKMVAPVPIEDKIKSSPYVAQACMVGEGRKYFTMLVTLAEGVSRNQQVEENIKNIQESVNANLAGYEKIKYISILERDFSIENGELTPTMKMKRAVIERNWANVIEEMYQNS